MKRTSKRIIFWTLCIAFFTYSLLVYTLGTSSDSVAPPITAEARVGKTLFQENNCIACHQICGLGGYMGPDLTNANSRPNGPAIIRAFLQAGTARMPNYNFNESEIESLAAYLQYVDVSVKYPQPEAEATWYGNISQPENKVK